MSQIVKAAFFGDPVQIERVYAQGRREQVARRVDLLAHVVSGNTLEDMLPRLADLQVVFSTWGMPALSDKHLGALPNLKAVFYAAGSVQHFARPLLERGIIVVSAWRANGIPVAEFTVAQILLAMKGYFRNTQQCRSHTGRAGNPFTGKGNFGQTIALLGAGAIGRRVIELLKPFRLNIVVFDPFLSNGDAARLGVGKVSLEQAFAQGYVVSNHLANLPATRKMIRGEHFTAMLANATFINTGRGATIDESEMIQVLGQRPDLTALLDVSDPEPPAADSPLYGMSNILLSSHIAGSIGDEVIRMADFCLDEFDRFQARQPLEHAVSLEMLETMA